MKHHVGLDVSLKKTSIRVVNQKRGVVKEGCSLGAGDG